MNQDSIPYLTINNGILKGGLQGVSGAKGLVSVYPCCAVTVGMVVSVHMRHLGTDPVVPYACCGVCLGLGKKIMAQE